MFKTILVPTDASETARRALMVAINIAKKYSSRIVLLHVVSTPEALGYSLSSGISGPQEEGNIYGGQALRATLSEIDPGKVPIEEKLIPGYPATAILEEVKNEKVDLVVMGNRGYGTITGSLLGSVSQRILVKSQCPVMIVK